LNELVPDPDHRPTPLYGLLKTLQRVFMRDITLLRDLPFTFTEIDGMNISGIIATVSGRVDSCNSGR
jgi:hypothetical protein